MTTMIRKSSREARSEDTVGTETKIENDETQTEAKEDENSEDTTVVETNAASSDTSDDGESEYVPPQPSSETHVTSTSTSSKKSEQGAMSALRGALISLADGGASQMIKEAIQNLELKLK